MKAHRHAVWWEKGSIVIKAGIPGLRYTFDEINPCAQDWLHRSTDSELGRLIVAHGRDRREA